MCQHSVRIDWNNWGDVHTEAGTTVPEVETGVIAAIPYGWAVGSSFNPRLPSPLWSDCSGAYIMVSLICNLPRPCSGFGIIERRVSNRMQCQTRWRGAFDTRWCCLIYVPLLKINIAVENGILRWALDCCWGSHILMSIYPLLCRVQPCHDSHAWSLSQCSLYGSRCWKCCQ